MNNMYGFTPLETLLYLILVFAPFLFCMVPCLIYHGLWLLYHKLRKEEAER